MAFSIELRFLTGACRAARGRADRAPDWPVQPDRIFSALVASWGARGEDEAEAEALRWLESLPGPRLYAADAGIRRGVSVYVPVNDTVVKGKANRIAARDLIAARHTAERSFPAALLPLGRRGDTPLLHLLLSWDADLPEDHCLPLSSLASDVRHIGHSSSLVACSVTDYQPPREETQPARRWVHAGRLDALIAAERGNAAGDQAGLQRRPEPGIIVADKPNEDVAPSASPYGERWQIFPLGDGPAIALTATARIAETIRTRIIAKAGGDLPEVLSAHAANGGPSAAPHLAILTLPHVGRPHADGSVKGVALVLPRAMEDNLARALGGAADEAATRALDAQRALNRALKAIGDDSGDSKELRFDKDRLVVREAASSLAALNPDRWSAESTVWATVTPLVLDRHLKAKRREPKGGVNAKYQEEMERAVKLACDNVGLPEPVEVRADKHSAHEGAPSVRLHGPPQTRWAVPHHCRTRSLTHAVLTFAEPMRGPLLLGAGRHYGLGLCAPVR
ncbi:MAG: type I-U CRISPR-associated protein Csb2 [Pseudomonadota bacterium]